MSSTQSQRLVKHILRKIVTTAGGTGLREKLRSYSMNGIANFQPHSLTRFCNYAVPALEVKYMHAIMTTQHFIFVSNNPPETNYPQLRRKNLKLWEAVKRRLTMNVPEASGTPAKDYHRIRRVVKAFIFRRIKSPK